MHDVACSILQESRFRQLSHLAKMIHGQTAIDSQADLLVYHRKNPLVNHSFIEGLQGCSLSISSDEIMHLLHSIPIVSLPASLRVKRAKDALDQVIVIICLPLVDHVLPLPLDSRMLT